MADGLAIGSLQAPDLADYKVLRDRVLSDAPEAFTSDAAEESLKSAPRPTKASSAPQGGKSKVAKPHLLMSAQGYLARLGLDAPEGGQFTLGAWRAGQLVGAVTCQGEPRVKGRHIGHIAGMMVCAQARGQGVGRGLLAACLARARRAAGLEMLTLSVTPTNRAAIHLYQQAGFECYGTLARAIKIGADYHDKDLMVLTL